MKHWYYGYKVIEEDPGQLVATIEEAVSTSKFMPLLPKEAPQRILAFQDRIVLDYSETNIVETAVKFIYLLIWLLNQIFIYIIIHKETIANIILLFSDFNKPQFLICKNDTIIFINI